MEARVVGGKSFLDRGGRMRREVVVGPFELALGASAGIVAFRMGGLVKLVPRGPGETYAVAWAR